MDSLIHQLRHDIDVIESDHALYDENHFGERADAIDSIEFSVIDSIDALLPAHGERPELRALRQRGEVVRRRMEEADERLLCRLRARIRSRSYTRSDLAGSSWISPAVAPGQ